MCVHTAVGLFFSLTTMSSSLRHVARRLTAQGGSRRSFATHASILEKDCTTITPPYSRLIENLNRVRQLLDGRPLTLAEKILYSHIHEPERTVSGKKNIRGEYLMLRPQRVAMQDASAQ